MAWLDRNTAILICTFEPTFVLSPSPTRGEGIICTNNLLMYNIIGLYPDSILLDRHDFDCQWYGTDRIVFLFNLI